MPPYFADTSAVAKLYVSEAGSHWVRSLDFTGLVVSNLVVVEMASLVSRLEREGRLEQNEAALIWAQFGTDLRLWAIVQLADDVLQAAAASLRAGVPLRSLDAIQLACALEGREHLRRRGLGPLVFLTADARLEAQAQALGLETDNPLHHA